MNQRLREYIDALFQEAPNTKKTVEMKEEILQNLTEKYNDLLEEGKTEEAAYNIAVASIGDIAELIEELKESGMNEQHDENYNAAQEHQKKRGAILTSAAIGLYVFCIVPAIIFENNFGAVLMFTTAAIATVLLIYSRMTAPNYKKQDDTIAEEFKEWRETTSNKHQVYKSISSALWLLLTVVYFLVSFSTMAWHVTWVIFLIGAAINNIMKAVFDLQR